MDEITGSQRERQAALAAAFVMQLEAWAAETAQLNDAQRSTLAKVEGRIPLKDLREYNAKKNTG